MGTRIKSTTKYKALLAVLGDEEAAVIAYHEAEGTTPAPAKPEVDPIAQLVAAGFTEAQAKAAIAKAATVETAPAVITSKDQGEVLVAESGLTFTKGRVYGGLPLAEAITRVAETGTPEIVESSGVGRTKGVLVYREESGDVALQNLAAPRA